MEEHSGGGGGGLHFAEEEVCRREVVVEDVEGGFESGVEEQGGDEGCERRGVGFGGVQEGRGEGEGLGVEGGEGGGGGHCGGFTFCKREERGGEGLYWGCDVMGLKVRQCLVYAMGIRVAKGNDIIERSLLRQKGFLLS